MKNKRNFGFSLIGILIIIGALVITTGGVVVWKKRTSPAPTPMPTPTLRILLSPTRPQEIPTSCTTSADCPPVLGVCMPGKCPTYRCINGRCVYFEDAKAAPSQTLSFSQLWQRRDELVGQQVSVKAKINLVTACPHYEGCCGPGECAATVILGENLGANYVNVFLHEAGERITCRWPKENSNNCQGWEINEQYLITGILGQEGYNFNLEVLSKQKL